MKPTSFSLSSLTASLQKVPRPVLYGGAGVVLVGAVGLWLAFNQPADSTAAVNTPPVATSPSPATATPPASTPTADPTAPVDGSDDVALTAGPSRSLEVQPIPFLVTTPGPNGSTDGTQAVQVSSGQDRDTVVSNPFAPLELPPVEVQPDAPVAATPTTPISTPGASNLPPINARPVQVVRPRPLPSTPDRTLPSLPSRPVNPPTTRTPSVTQTPLPSGNPPVVVRNPQAVPVAQAPKAIRQSKPVVRAPRATTGDLPEPAQIGGALPITPSLIRQVITAPEPQQPTVTVVTPPPPAPPATPTELPSDLASVSQPQVNDTGSELRGSESTNTDTTPTPLDSSIPRPAPTPTAPPPPVDNGTPTPPPTVTTPPAQTITRLERFVQDRDVSFVGVVLGPVNTAILATKDGTVVIPLGGTLPQSDVVVKTITADQVVLMQDQDTIVLNRNNK